MKGMWKPIAAICLAVVMVLGISGATSTAQAQQPPHLEVSKSANPSEIYQKGSELTPDKTTVTLTVSGAGEAVAERFPLDVIFALDSSGSMGWNDPDGIRKEGAKEFVDRMDATRDQAGVVSWDDGIDFTLELTNDFTLVKQNIDNVDASGGTDLDVGLNAAINLLDAGARVGSVHAIIFLTDGIGDYTPSGQPGSPADRAAAAGYVVYTIGLSPDVDEAVLREIADVTGGAYYYAENADDIPPIYNDIVQRMINTAGTNIVVTEVLPAYINNEDAFTIPPDNITPNPDGTTTIAWNVGTLSIGDVWTVAFDVSCNDLGRLLVDVYGDAKVTYIDYQGNPAEAVFPETYITCMSPAPAAPGGLCGGAIAGIVSGAIIALGLGTHFLLAGERRRVWRCSACGYSYKGVSPPDKCPRCGGPGENFRLQ